MGAESFGTADLELVYPGSQLAHIQVVRARVQRRFLNYLARCRNNLQVDLSFNRFNYIDGKLPASRVGINRAVDDLCNFPDTHYAFSDS